MTMTKTCGHPFADDTVGLCTTCQFRERHNSHAAKQGEETCSCFLCEKLRDIDTLEPVERELALSVWAFSFVEDAITLYEALGKDALDIEALVRDTLIFPPVEMGTSHPDWASGDIVDAYTNRMNTLESMPYSDYMRTPEWAERRRRAAQRAGGRCQGCNTTENLETHHRTYENRGCESELDLTVLCAGCHTAVHLVADGRRGKVRSESRRAKV